MKPPKSKRRPETIQTAQKIWGWINEFQKKHGYPPTRREIGDAFSASTSVVTYWLDLLVETGKMKPAIKGMARGLVLIQPKESK